jgi:ABC-type nitrate/sulfonate/bicarbonate transport system substrate-binding protein
MNEQDLEKPQLTLGYIPLTDCAPLVVAREHGYFQKYGLEVNLSKETSWANIRDKLAIGILDGAHMLAPMPLAMSAGVGPVQKDMITALSLDLNGNAITVSTPLYQAMLAADPENAAVRANSAKALRQVIEQRRASGAPALTFATVFPTSTHTYELRYWMASAGIDPDRDVRLVVVPPPQMVGSLERGSIDGFCVGEPWNSVAVDAGLGRTVLTKYEFWNNSPEKVFGVTAEWAEQYPATHMAVVKALLEACRWLDEQENREPAAELLAQSRYLNVDTELVRRGLTGHYHFTRDAAPETIPDFGVFHRFAANFPWRSHAIWLLTQMARWGQLPPSIDFEPLAEQVYRPDLYRQAADALGINAPLQDYKSEGDHGQSWSLNGTQGPLTLGSDCFFDGGRFDPRRPLEYLAELSPTDGARDNVVPLRHGQERP